MTPVSHPGWESDLLELLERQHDLYAQLQALAQNQEQIVAGPEPDLSSLARVSARRRNLVDQLARISQRIEPYRRHWPAVWPSLDGDARARILALIAHVQGLLDTMLGQEPGRRSGRCT